MLNKYTKSLIRDGALKYIVNLDIEYCGDSMRPSQVMEGVREKAKEAAEKAGEVIGKGWSEAKGLGKGLKKELLRVHRKTEGNKKSCARGSRRNQRRK